jgi:hypothetical protein
LSLFTSKDEMHWVANNADAPRLDRHLATWRPHFGCARILAQEKQSVREARADRLETGDEARELVPVHWAEAGLAGELVHVDVEDACAAVKHLLHGLSDRLAVDAGTRPRVVNVTLVCKRDVPGEKNKQVVGPDDSEPREKKPDALGGKWVRARQVGPHLIVKLLCEPDPDIHVKALK